LIDTGEADVNDDIDPDDRIWTALHWASYRGYLEIAELLASSGADLNIGDSDGWTALMWASFTGHLEMVQLLLCQGVDMSIRTNYGRFALEIASSRSHLDVANCLRKWPCTMAIIALQEIDIYKYIDFSSIEDFWHYLGNQ
jgi:ankyrin repeat protein